MHKFGHSVYRARRGSTCSSCSSNPGLRSHYARSRNKQSSVSEYPPNRPQGKSSGRLNDDFGGGLFLVSVSRILISAQYMRRLEPFFLRPENATTWPIFG